LVLAGNRDERLDRAWDPPGPWWPESPGIVGGRDRMAGGTWMALGASGVVAAALNRPGSLGPAEGKRSRGELPLLAAARRSAAEAAATIAALPAGEWRPFNLVIADHARAFFLRGPGRGHPQVVALPEGISMVTAHDPNDLSSPRTRRHLPRFRAAVPPEPDRDEWSSWATLLADDGEDPDAGIASTLNVPPVGGFGTVSSSLLALAPGGGANWRFCAGRPGSAPYRPVPLPAPAIA
jgi:uncharacterized protein with NRDE domain